MSAIFGLWFLFTVLCASVSGVQGMCREVKNDDMIEFSCTGGQLSDLDSLPPSTGKIGISDMPIQRITADTFSRFGSELWVLGCSHCGIMDIEPGAFERLKSLQQLSLDNNQLTTVRESWFRGLDYLTFLDLNYNNINSIEDGVFKNLPSLVDLRLSGNRLECLSLEGISHLKELKRMFLTENSEFKCPYALSTFLERRGVNLEKDPEWDRLPSDLVLVDLPIDYDTYDEESTTEEPTTPLPAYRERLHPTSTTSEPTMPSTPSYVTPKFLTTEEVIYRPYNTPYWRTTVNPSIVYHEVSESTSPSYYDTRRPPYIPPETIAPIETTTDAPLETTTEYRQDITTLKPWSRFPESTSARPEYTVYPPHRNEDKHYTEQPDYSSPTDSFPLAPSPGDHQQTPPYVKVDMRHDNYEIDLVGETGTAPSNVEHPPSMGERGPPGYSIPSVDDVSINPPDTTNAIRPISPEMVFPPSPDISFQSPYYEQPVTVHTPPLIANQPQLKEVPTAGVSVESIKPLDKPLPECPTRNLSPSLQQSSSLIMIIVSIFFVKMHYVLVEGF